MKPSIPFLTYLAGLCLAFGCYNVEPSEPYTAAKAGSGSSADTDKMVDDFIAQFPLLNGNEPFAL